MISQAQIRDLRFLDNTAASLAGRPNEVCFVESLNEHFYYKVDNLLVDDGVSILTASGTDAFWVKVGAAASSIDTFFVSEGAMAPLTAGDPTSAEVLAWFNANAGGATSGFVRYNGTGTDSIFAPHVLYYVVSPTEVVIVKKPASLDVLFADETSMAPAVAGSPTPAELNTWVTNFVTASARKAFIIRYSGTDFNNDPITYVWYYNDGDITVLRSPSSPVQLPIWAASTFVSTGTLTVAVGSLWESKSDRMTGGSVFDFTESTEWNWLGFAEPMTAFPPATTYIPQYSLLYLDGRNYRRLIGGPASASFTAESAAGMWASMSPIASGTGEIVSKAAHGFLIGQAVYHNGTTWVKAQAPLLCRRERTSLWCSVGMERPPIGSLSTCFRNRVGSLSSNFDKT
jgi:hypothetical protein